jgi:hypothetical protein
MIFKTASGSAYELDAEAKRIRRVEGAVSATRRQGQDGSWREYREVSVVMPGYGVVIVWPDGVPLLPGSPEHAVPATVTSPVTEVFDQGPQ